MGDAFSTLELLKRLPEAVVCPGAEAALPKLALGGRIGLDRFLAPDLEHVPGHQPLLVGREGVGLAGDAGVHVQSLAAVAVPAKEEQWVAPVLALGHARQEHGARTGPELGKVLV